MMSQIYIKIISLAHRDDRRNECLEELYKIGLGDLSDVFFEAKYVESLGDLGCALSHAKVLSDFLFQSDKSHILVLEDDFQLKQPANFMETINEAIINSRHWDVFLLGHNGATPIESTNMHNALRVINSQTLSGYLVNRSYVPKLIGTFFHSAELLRNYKNLPYPHNEYARTVFCCDMLWKRLQVDDRYWATLPSLIKQRKSYSDIQKKVTDYGV